MSARLTQTHCSARTGKKKLRSKIGLEIQMRTHTGEKPHQCKVCKKRLSTYANLNIHMSQHTDITYICKQCDKEYKHKSSLACHVRDYRAEETDQS